MFTLSRKVLSAIIAVYIYIMFNLCNWNNKQMLRWDSTSYYLYLPAVFIYKDLGTLSFYPRICKDYYLNLGATDYGIYDGADGKKLIRYAVGTSLFELPFFVAAQVYCSFISTEYPADGYSAPYLAAINFAYIFWVIAGLFVLRRFLTFYFTETAVATTLLLLAFGTNLYFYTVFEIGMAHPFSFTLFCYLLYYTHRWYASEQKKYVILMGVVIGLLTIVRPVDVLVIIIPVCWPRYGRIADRLVFLKRQAAPMLMAVVACVLILMIQCGYWKYVTGHWLYYSYRHERFQFYNPQIWNGLFSYRKGWLVYTPVVLPGLLGLIPLARHYRYFAILLCVYFAITIYVVFCWWDWMYGGSFGCRALIESLAILSIPLAMFVQWVLSRGKLLVSIAMFIVFAFLIALNTFQSYQLITGQLSWYQMNKTYYWRSFGKLHVTNEDRTFLEQ